MKKQSKQITTFIILAISFLIECPLRTIIISMLSFSQSLAYIITGMVFYIALFACFLIAFGSNITSKTIIKLICVVLAFFAFEKIMSLFLFSEFVALAYEIIRPLLIFIVILFANGCLTKTKFSLNKWFWVILGCVFVIGTLFNVLEYVRISAAMQSMENDFYSYLNLLIPSNSIYTILAKLCTYIFTFVLLMRSND